MCSLFTGTMGFRADTQVDVCETWRVRTLRCCCHTGGHGNTLEMTVESARLVSSSWKCYDYNTVRSLSISVWSCFACISHKQFIQINQQVCCLQITWFTATAVDFSRKEDDSGRDRLNKWSAAREKKNWSLIWTNRSLYVWKAPRASDEPWLTHNSAAAPGARGADARTHCEQY